MKTQNVLMQTVAYEGNVSKGKQQSGGDFDMIMGINLKKNVSDLPVSDTANNNTQTSRKMDDTSTANVTLTNSTPEKYVKNVSSTQDTSSVTVEIDEDDLSEDEMCMAQIAVMLQSIRETIMNVLNINTEELDQLMLDQGMTLGDLLEPESLQQLVLSLNEQTDISAFLTDENLAASIQDLMKEVNQTITDTNISLTPDEIKSILADLDQTVLTDTEKETAVMPAIPHDENDMEDEIIIKDKSQPDVLVTVDQGEDEVIHITNAEQSSKGSQSNEDHKDTNNQFNMFVDNMVKTSYQVQESNDGSMVQVTELRDIANQIIEQIKIVIKPDQSVMELQLNPDHLGKVNLSVQSKDGVMTAQFLVQNEISKEAIESQIQVLKDTLGQQGIKVEAIEVAVDNSAFQQRSDADSQNQQSSNKGQINRGITLEEAMNMNELPEEENHQTIMTGVLGSQIDYTA